MITTVTPRVVVTYEALQAMTDEVWDHQYIETSWQQVGFVVNERDVILTNIIRPGHTDVVRTSGHTVVGGAFNRDCYQWLVDEFAKLNAANPGMYPPNMAYGYLFAGHSHHRLGINNYSGRDIQSIQEAVVDDNLTVALGPLVNIVTSDFGQWRMGFYLYPTVSVNRENRMNWKFYYLSREMVTMGTKEPILVQPHFVRQAELRFKIPSLGWRFADPARFERQMSLLVQKGWQVSVVNRDLPDYKHMAVQFVIDKPGWKSPVVVNTPWNYPYGDPPGFVVVLEGKKQTLPNKIRTGVGVETVIWTPESDLCDSVARLESLGVV